MEYAQIILENSREKACELCHLIIIKGELIVLNTSDM